MDWSCREERETGRIELAAEKWKIRYQVLSIARTCVFNAKYLIPDT
jgi:hypothetical protein